MSRFGAEGGFPTDQHRPQPGDRRDGPDPNARQARPDLPDGRARHTEGNQQHEGYQAQPRQQGVEDPSTRASRPELQAPRSTQEAPTWATPRSDLGRWGKVEYERPERQVHAPVKKDPGGPGTPSSGRGPSTGHRQRTESERLNADAKKHSNERPRRF
jgi:hypothetical protein